jgi:3-oxoacyl-[acyl-carrier-protein] synthase II
MSGEVFVTGMGIVSGLGLGVDETLNSLLLSKSGIGKIKHLETINDIPCAEVDYSDSEMKKLLHLEEDSVVPRTALMGILAVKEVLDSAQFPLNGTYKVAFINGTTVGGMEKSELYYFDFLQNDSRNKYIEAHDCGSLTEKIADYFGGFSYVSTPSTACSSAANAVILGVNLIDAGIVDAAIVGGSECITKFHLNGFKSLMILDSTPCKPFDQNRVGLNLGEGAAFLLLESSELVKSRKSKPLAQVKGYGNACDAYHQTASSPEGKGATLAMQAALKMSGLNADDINYINAHGTGTQNNDESEGNAIINVFGKIPPPVSSTKSLTGHTTSASGGVEAVISILAINHDFIPANANFKTQMEALSFAPVKELIQNIEVKNVLSNSFGFGGNNTSLIFSKVY